jgi:hypothetical protein
MPVLGTLVARFYHLTLAPRMRGRRGGGGGESAETLAPRLPSPVHALRYHLTLAPGMSGSGGGGERAQRAKTSRAHARSFSLVFIVQV